jgi:transcriptional regulator with XRE-family HTH domain
MTQADHRPEQSRELGAQLRALRSRAQLSGVQMASQLDWVQSKVSRIENGRQLPSDADLDSWLRLVVADAETTAKLQGLLGDARAAQAVFRSQLRQHDLANMQINVDELAREATTIRNVEVAVIPGLLQTPEYARHRLRDSATWFDLNEQEVEGAVARRMQRQTVLYDTSKRFWFILTEGILRTLLCPQEVMLAQLDRLSGVLGMPNIELGIIPFGVRLPTVPLHGFAMFDEVVVVETYDTELVLRASEAGIYTRVVDRLMKIAYKGEAARRVISRVQRDLETQ